MYHNLTVCSAHSLPSLLLESSLLNNLCLDTIWYHLYVESKIGPKWTYLWNRNRLRRRTDLWLSKRKGLGEHKLGAWGQQIQTTICKINNKFLLYSTENHIQHCVISHKGKEYGGKGSAQCFNLEDSINETHDQTNLHI